MADSKARGRSAPAKDEPTTPTPAEQWRKDDLICLPSGNVARLKRPALFVLASRGLIPNPYLAPIRKLLTGRDPDRAEDDRWKTFDENLQAYLGVAQLALQEPRLILDKEPGPGEIGPDSLSDQDLLWLYFTYTEGGESDIAPFRVG